MIDALIEFLLIPIVALAGIIIGLFYKGIDRILVARMQKRVGPPLTQPFRDVAKLIIKDNIVPDNSVEWIFNSMPIIALSFSVLILLYLPIGGIQPLLGAEGDIILVLYLFIVPALSLALGGFSSGSPYANIGSKREMIKLMSYELPLAVVIVSIVWILSTRGVANPFSLFAITSTPVWSMVGPLGLIGLIIMLAVMLFVMPAELNSTPFDVPSASSELAGGILAEYSGRNLALFYMADAVKVVAVGSLVIALFLPWGISGMFAIVGVYGLVLDVIFFLFKLFVVIFIGSTVMRTVAARFSITRVVYVYWTQSFLI